MRVRLAPLNRFKPSSKIFYWPFQGGISFVDTLCFCSVLCLLCLCARLFICALWSPAGKGLTSWLSFVVSGCEFVTFPLVSWVKCGTWLYRFLIFAPLLTFTILSNVYVWNIIQIVCKASIISACLSSERDIIRFLSQQKRIDIPPREHNKCHWNPYNLSIQLSTNRIKRCPTNRSAHHIHFDKTMHGIFGCSEVQKRVSLDACKLSRAFSLEGSLN